jgi:large subunit ribosomal protein L24
MRGDHKGFEGKISRVDLKHFRLYVEGLTREKVDGTTIFVSLHPSKVMIKSLNLDDKWRKEIVERKKRLAQQEGVEKKPQQGPAKEKIAKSEEKADLEKKPEKPQKKPRVAKIVKETAVKKSTGTTQVQVEKKTGKKATKTEAPAKKARAKPKSSSKKGGEA